MRAQPCLNTMRSSGAFSIIFLEFLSVTKSTIDMNIPELRYIANHLTLKECRRVVASLHFEANDMPALLEQKVPDGVPCIKLLIKWNGEEGKTKTHEDIARELRLIGRYDVADWLGVTLFHKLSDDLDDALLNSFSDTDENEDDVYPRFKNTSYDSRRQWVMIDSVLYVLLMGIIGAILLTLWRMLVLSFSRTDKTVIEEEELCLFSNHDIDDDDDIEDAESISVSLK